MSPTVDLPHLTLAAICLWLSPFAVSRRISKIVTGSSHLTVSPRNFFYCRSLFLRGGRDPFKWPDISGMAGRVFPESLAGCYRNLWPDKAGILINTGNGNNMFKFMLTILGAVAEMERELTVERVREGIRKAKLYGTRSGNPIGRPVRIIPPSFKKYYAMWKDKEITGVEFAKLLEVSRPTLYRYIREYEGGSFS